LSAFAGSLKERRLANGEVERDVGEHDAIGRHRVAPLAYAELPDLGRDLTRFKT